MIKAFQPEVMHIFSCAARKAFWSTHTPTYPVIGAKILMKSNYMQEFVQIVMHHHERFDGKGYPNGLSGDEIQAIIMSNPKLII